MAFAYSGFSTVAQNYISRTVASNFYQKWPFGAALGALTLGNQNRKELQIGRPDSGEILSGGMISPIERINLGNVNWYQPRIQAFETSNSAYRTVRGNLPDVAAKTTNSHGQATQASAKVGWTHLDTPVLIWHEDKIRAAKENTAKGQALALGQVIDEATEVAYQEHISKLAVDTYSGSPTSQSADLWDAPQGYKMAFSATNTYSNVDRSVESAWRAQSDSTITAVDIVKILDDANITKGLNTKGSGVDLILTTGDLYIKFKAQILSQGGTVLQNGMPEFAKLGVKREVLQKDNAYIMYDPYISDANRVYAFNTKTWRFMVHPQFNFKVSEFTDNTKTGINKETYDYAYISTRFMLSCDDPTKNVVYTAIGT